MFQSVTFTGRVAEILQNGETVVEIKKEYTSNDVVKQETAYVYLRDNKNECQVDHLVHVEGRFIPNADGTPPVNGHPKYILKPNATTILGPYIEDVKDSDFFRIEIIGHCGRDADVRQTKTGKTVVSIGIAVDIDLGIDGKQTVWFKVTDWPRGEKPSPLASLKKGERVMVRGNVDYDPQTGMPRSYEKDGVTKASFDIKFPYVMYLSPKSAEKLAVVDDQDIPF